MEANKINLNKIRLEAKLTNKIYRVLKNQAKDVARLYDGDTQQVADNYRPEIIKEVRDGLRMSFAVFGNLMRKSIEKEFTVAFKSIEKDKFANINRQIALFSSLFIANESENQAELITLTSANEIVNVIKRQTDIKTEEISRLIREQNDLLLVNTDKAKRRIATIETIVRNAKRDIAKNIEINLLSNAKSRARLIGEQVIGIGESSARNLESSTINNAKITTNKGVIAISKTWVAILDNKTRDSHVVADGQEVGVDDSFTVGGESLKYPRDPSGSAENTIRCRCVAIYDKKYY